MLEFHGYKSESFESRQKRSGRRSPASASPVKGGASGFHTDRSALSPLSSSDTDQLTLHSGNSQNVFEGKIKPKLPELSVYMNTAIKMSHLDPRLMFAVWKDAMPMVEQGKSAREVATPKVVEAEVIDVLSNNLAKLLP